MSVLGIISAAVGVCLTLYCHLLRVESQEKARIAREVSQPAKKTPATELPYKADKKTPERPCLQPLSPETQAKIRAHHIDLVQRSIVTKLRDVDTFFQTRDLSNSARILAQRHAENQRAEYLNMMDRAYNVPIVVQAQVQPGLMRRGTPWIPGPGSWDPVADDSSRLPGSFTRSEYAPRGGRVRRDGNVDGQRIRRWLDELPLPDDRERDEEWDEQGVAKIVQDDTISVNSRMTHVSI